MPEIHAYDKMVSSKFGDHEVKVYWWPESTRITLAVDNKAVVACDADVVIYERIVDPLLNGDASEELIDCLTAIYVRVRWAKNVDRYVRLLAFMGPQTTMKWIEKRGRAIPQLRRMADLNHATMLGFLCRNGWVVFNIDTHQFYARLTDKEKLVFGKMDGYCGDILLCEHLQKLREEVGVVYELYKKEMCTIYYTYGEERLLGIFLRDIPTEWHEKLGLDVLAVEQALKSS
jgi:hypothetical protein